MNFSFLGGALEVGASCILLNIHGKNILLDCGIRQGGSKDILPDFSIIQNNGGIDAIIISHAHMDHTGSLPIISKEYPQARIYMNNMTKDLIRVLLYDSLKIMGSREAEIPLYAEADVENMLNKIFTLNYQVDFEMFEGIKVCFYNAGHIAGASCVYIVSDEGSVFYSGDFSIFPQKTVEGAKIPKLRPDAAIFESTYGDKLHSNREIEEQKLIDLASECINKNGKMLIPAFALGRAQEILLILKKAMNNNKLKKINIYVDGMVKNINRVYKLNPLFLKSDLGKKILKGMEPFYNDNIQIVENKEHRETILSSKESCIIVSSSGMLTGGPSQFYAEKLCSIENSYIVISGYQDEESPGRKLLNLINAEKDEDKVLQINGKNVPVKCEVKIVGLSAHGDKNEIKALINVLSPKNIFLVHGEETTIQSLGCELSKEFISNIYTPRAGDSVEINIKNPRKQLKKSLPFLMKEKEDISEDNISRLWKFVIDNYKERFLTIEELLIIWYGSARLQNSHIEKLQGLMVNSVYFENDLRRFFMFKAKNANIVEEDLKPKELKPNEISELTTLYFGTFEYKKAGLKQEEKKVILYFDFPKAVDKSIYNKFSEFKTKTSWDIELYSQSNNNALESSLKNILYGVNIKKFSHIPSENKVIITTDDIIHNTCEMQEQFKTLTGFTFEVKSPTINNPIEINNYTFKPSNGTNFLEQNEALKVIDEAFNNEPHAPYKKSIKTNVEGKYIELSFVTPVIGKLYEEKIKVLSEHTGWILSIGTSINQNEIISLIVSLCSKENIKLLKNPSFNLTELKITIKPEIINDIALNSINDLLQKDTGCVLKW